MKSSAVHISFELGEHEHLWVKVRDAFVELMGKEPSAGAVVAMALMNMALNEVHPSTPLVMQAGRDPFLVAHAGQARDENAAKLMRINFVCVGPDDKLCAAKVHGYKVFCDQCERTWDISHLDEVTPS